MLIQNFDCESDEEIHEQRFKDAMDNMKKVKKFLVLS